MVDNISKPLRLYYDNKTAIFYTNSNKSSGAAKHIKIKYFVENDRIQDHTIELEHISTTQMLALIGGATVHAIAPQVVQRHNK